MFNQHPATELQILEESTRLDLLFAAWGVRRHEASKEEQRKVRLQRELNRELAYMIALAVNGKELPELPPEEGEDDNCLRGGYVVEEAGEW